MANTRSKSHIQVFEENTKGNDLIIGDLHGNLGPLSDVLPMLKSRDDRLFIAGDLTDRGSDNVEIINKILKYNKDWSTPGTIYAVRGNHEAMCVDTIDALEQLYLNFNIDVSNADLNEARRLTGDETITKADIALELFENSLHEEEAFEGHHASVLQLQHHAHPGNGGKWLHDLFMQEIEKGYVVVEDDRIKYHPNSRVNMVKKFINDLPVIVHVQGEKPFNMVHADMPISDNVLMARIKNKAGLSDSELDHALWARMDEKEYAETSRRSARNVDSVPVYVGHTIISDDNLKACVRKETNTFDLDVASFHTGVTVVVNHTDGKCVASRKVAKDSTLAAVVKRINHYQKKQPGYAASRKFKSSSASPALMSAKTTPAKRLGEKSRKNRERLNPKKIV